MRDCNYILLIFYRNEQHGAQNLLQFFSLYAFTQLAAWTQTTSALGQSKAGLVELEALSASFVQTYKSLVSTKTLHTTTRMKVLSLGLVSAKSSNLWLSHYFGEVFGLAILE